MREERPRNVARAGTPGIVSGIHFDTVMNTSFRAKWSPPSDGGHGLTGYGILLWTGDVVSDKPDYSEATTIGVPTTFEENRIKKQAQTFTGLPSGTTHHYLMHACNPIGCGHWSYPAKQVTTTGTSDCRAGADHRPAVAATRPHPASPAFDQVLGYDVDLRAGDVERAGRHGRGSTDRLRPQVLALRSREPRLGDAAPSTQLADGGSDRSETVDPGWRPAGSTS